MSGFGDQGSVSEALKSGPQTQEAVSWAFWPRIIPPEIFGTAIAFSPQTKLKLVWKIREKSTLISHS